MTATAEEYDWSDLDDSKAEVRETNVMPRQGSTSRTPAGTRRRGTRTSKKIDNLQAALSGQMFQVGTMLGLGMPVTGYYIAQESSNFTSAIVQLAQKRVEWVEALEKLADIGPGITIGRTVLGIAASMGADRYHRTHGESGFDPEKRACQFLGVTAAYYAVYKETDNDNTAGFTPPPHGTFIPVA